MESPVQLSQPLLAQHTQYEKERKSLLSRLRDGRHGLLAAAASQTGLSHARTRSLLLKRKLRKEKEPTESWSWKFLMWPITTLKDLEKFKSPATLPVKAGLAAMIAGLLCFAPGFLKVMNKNGVWAVITVDIVLEANVGLTFSKGVNRTVGTLMAAALALLVNLLGQYMGVFENFFLLLCTFLGGAIPTMFKFRRPFKDRWNYAVVMSMVTFHLLILTKTDQKIELPLIRLADIAVGFVVASIVNILFLPNFAGNNINNLLAQNFERAGNVVEKCVLEYCRGTVLQHFPEGVTQFADNDLHACFHEIISADSEVEKLLVAAKFEPPHGKFFWGYPWHMYEDIAENLRFTFYDVVALDSCLRAEIQAPLNLRNIFEAELLALGKECAEVFRALGTIMRKMEQYDSRQILERAEEVALLLQHNIAKYADFLLQGAPCPGPPQGPPNDRTESFVKELLEAHSILSSDESSDDDIGASASVAASKPTDTTDMSQAELSNEVSEERKTKEKQIQEKAPKLEGPAGDILKRRGSIGVRWDITVKRLAALSLIKFASILIEIAAKAKFVVGVVDEVAVKAHFDKCKGQESKPSEEFFNAFGTI